MTFPDGYREDEEEDEDEIYYQQWTCDGCCCEFYIMCGVSPSFCPTCGAHLIVPALKETTKE